MIAQTGCSQLLHEHVNMWGSVKEDVFWRSNKCVCQQKTVSSHEKDATFHFSSNATAFQKISFCLFVLGFFFFWKEAEQVLRASSSHRKCAAPDTRLKILHMFHAARSLMFDMMNMLPLQGHTSCICLCEKQSDQIILLHANPTALRQGWLLPAQPLNFHPKQMCMFCFFEIA